MDKEPIMGIYFTMLVEKNLEEFKANEYEW